MEVSLLFINYKLIFSTIPPTTLPNLEQLTVVPKAKANSYPTNHLLIKVDFTTDRFSPPSPKINLPINNHIKT